MYAHWRALTLQKEGEGWERGKRRGGSRGEERRGGGGRKKRGKDKGSREMKGGKRRRIRKRTRGSESAGRWNTVESNHEHLNKGFHKGLEYMA